MYRKSAREWRYPLAWLAACGVIWLALAIVFVAIQLFVLAARRLRFSNFAYTCLFLFFVFHAIGAHYTYSLVPYDDWWQSIGGDAREGRNDHDRIAHLVYGFLVTPHAVEKDMELALPGTTIMLATLASAGRLPIRRACFKGDAPL